MAQHTLKGKVVRVTPSLAKTWLATITKQRPLHQPTVDYYARLIEEGQWALTGQAIQFSHTGALIDGQHRLQAIIQTGKGMDFYVIRGVDPKTFDVIDTGRNRRTSDVLGILGETTVLILGSALGALYRYDQVGTGGLSHYGGSIKIRLSNRDIEATLRKHPAIRDSINPSVLAGKLLGSPSLGATLHYLMAQRDRDAADLFFIQVGDGMRLRDRDPAYQLREYLITKKSQRKRTPLVDRTMTFIKAWNLFRQNKSANRQAISWRGSIEGMPEIE